MAWLSPLKGTTHCDVEYTGSVHDLVILEELARACPNVKRLKIVDDSASPQWLASGTSSEPQGSAIVGTNETEIA